MDTITPTLHVAGRAAESNDDTARSRNDPVAHRGTVIDLARPLWGGRKHSS